MYERAWLTWWAMEVQRVGGRTIWKRQVPVHCKRGEQRASRRCLRRLGFAGKKAARLAMNQAWQMARTEVAGSSVRDLAGRGKWEEDPRKGYESPKDSVGVVGWMSRWQWFKRGRAGGGEAMVQSLNVAAPAEGRKQVAAVQLDASVELPFLPRRILLH